MYIDLESWLWLTITNNATSSAHMSPKAWEQEKWKVSLSVAMIWLAERQAGCVYLKELHILSENLGLHVL